MEEKDFDAYQRFMENTISQLSLKISDLEQKLNVFTNLLEVSKYVNQFIKNENLFDLINDMLIGIFGASNSVTLMYQEGEYRSASPNAVDVSIYQQEIDLILQHNSMPFILNQTSPIFATNCSGKEDIYSCLGVPIEVRSELLGYIIIEHNQKNYFSKDHALFLTSLANHIAVALENNKLYNKIKENAYRDGLTGIFNRRYFFETLENQLSFGKHKYTLVMVDIDNFKKVNDVYGHPFGDIVLKRISQLLTHYTRGDDIVARYGGEEIIIYFKGLTDKQVVLTRLEQMRAAIENELISGEGVTSAVTASFGAYINNNEELSLEKVIDIADRNLYISKNSGKNKYTINN